MQTVIRRQSNLRITNHHYRNPGSKSLCPSGQPILFGCPLELRTVGELKKIPPVLEYLLDSVHDWPSPMFGGFTVGQKHRIWTANSLYMKGVALGLSVMRNWPSPIFGSFMVGQKHRYCTTNSLYRKGEDYWTLVNEIEQAWTGVEESDRAIISELVLHDNHRLLIMVCPLWYII